MHKERDTLRHFAMSIVKYRESHEVTVLDMYEEQGLFKNCVISFNVSQTPVSLLESDIFTLSSLCEKTRKFTRTFSKDCRQIRALTGKLIKLTKTESPVICNNKIHDRYGLGT